MPGSPREQSALDPVPDLVPGHGLVREYWAARCDFLTTKEEFSDPKIFAIFIDFAYIFKQGLQVEINQFSWVFQNRFGKG